MLIAPIDSGESAILEHQRQRRYVQHGVGGYGGLTKIGDGTLTLMLMMAYTYLGPTALQGDTELGLNAQAAVLQDGGADIQSGRRRSTTRVAQTTPRQQFRPS